MGRKLRCVIKNSIQLFQTKFKFFLLLRPTSVSCAKENHLPSAQYKTKNYFLARLTYSGYS